MHKWFERDSSKPIRFCRRSKKTPTAKTSEDRQRVGITIGSIPADCLTAGLSVSRQGNTGNQRSWSWKAGVCVYACVYVYLYVHEYVQVSSMYTYMYMYRLCPTKAAHITRSKGCEVESLASAMLDPGPMIYLYVDVYE